MAHCERLRDENIVFFTSIFPNLEVLDLSHWKGISEEIISQVLRSCKTNYNGLVESNIKYIEPLQGHVESEWKDEVDERGDEAIQQVEICPACHVSRFYLAKTGA